MQQFSMYLLQRGNMYLLIIVGSVFAHSYLIR
jgi:hypothetical protein